MKALVLGADGFMGKKMSLYLRNNGIEVRAFDISEMQDLRDLDGIECIQGDVQMIETMPELFEDVDQVYHFVCTSIPTEGTVHIPKEIEINLIPLVNLLQIIHDRGIERFVYLSSAGTIYGENDCINTIDTELRPICSYGTLKQVSEAYIRFYNRVYGHKYKIARVSNLYGIGQHIYKMQGIIPIFINAIMNEKTINIYGDGKKIRDYIYIDDVIEALYKVCNTNNDMEVYNIASGEGHSINEIVHIIEEVYGQRFKQIRYIDARKCDVDNNIVDIKDTVKELNWSPHISLRDGISKTIELMR